MKKMYISLFMTLRLQRANAVSCDESASASSLRSIFKEQRDIAHSNEEIIAVKSNPCNYCHRNYS